MATAFKYFVDINSINLLNSLQLQLNAFAKDHSVSLLLTNPYEGSYILQVKNQVSSPYIFQGTVQEIVNYWNAAMMYFNFVPPPPAPTLFPII